MIRKSLAAHSFAMKEESLLEEFPKSMVQLSFESEIYLFSSRQDELFLQNIETWSHDMKHLLLIHVNGQPTPGQVRQICIAEGGDVAAAFTAGAT